MEYYRRGVWEDLSGAAARTGILKKQEDIEHRKSIRMVGEKTKTHQQKR